MVIVPVMVSAVGHADSPASRQVSSFLTLKLTILYSMRTIDGFPPYVMTPSYATPPTRVPGQG